jgi:hypothetical protein
MALEQAKGGVSNEGRGGPATKKNLKRIKQSKKDNIEGRKETSQRGKKKT